MKAGEVSAADQLRSDLARTDTVMLHSLRAGFLRVGTDACLASAEAIAAEIARRTDASCEAWARNLRLPIDGRRHSAATAISTVCTADKSGSTYLACERMFAATVALGREIEAEHMREVARIAMSAPLGQEPQS